MKVSELILELSKMPQDAEVTHLWDGEPRTNIEVVYLSRKGEVVTADYDESCYDDIDRPIEVTPGMVLWSTPGKE